MKPERTSRSQRSAPRSSRDEPTALCGELGPDDGLDLRTLLRDEQRASEGEDLRKTWQLCKEVYRTLSLALATLQHLPWARDLFVDSVQPAPDAARLRVSLGFADAVTLVDAGRVLSKLSVLRGPLREEIAASLSRKRVPEIVFTLAPPSHAAANADTLRPTEIDEPSHAG